MGNGPWSAQSAGMQEGTGEPLETAKTRISSARERAGVSTPPPSISIHQTQSSSPYCSPKHRSNSLQEKTCKRMPLTRCCDGWKTHASTPKCPGLETSWTYKSKCKNSWMTYANRRGRWLGCSSTSNKPSKAFRRGWNGHVCIRHWQTRTHKWSSDLHLPPLTVP